ncbi:MAG: CAP domain-containing protein [Thermovenabulum sp.]|uniref:CAP domain-containing protein n=1 Tax=Thermovenabulum sp. TaxID=3100335 RepID=UPI003C7C7557
MKRMKNKIILLLLLFSILISSTAFAATTVNLNLKIEKLLPGIKYVVYIKYNGVEYLKTFLKNIDSKTTSTSNNNGASNTSQTKEAHTIIGLTKDEKLMLDLVNKERVKAGLKPLEVDMRLVDISRKKSKDMIEKNYFSHISPTYGSPFDALKNAGISYRYAGENIAGAPTVEKAHEALMNSPGHRANILNPNFNKVGIGIVDGGPYGKMFTQTFIGTN